MPLTARVCAPQCGGFHGCYLACAPRLEHAFRRDLSRVRAFVASRRRSEPELADRLAAAERLLERRIEEAAAAGGQLMGSALSEVHGDMLELHLRATSTSELLARGPYFAYRIEVIFPLNSQRILQNLIAALSAPEESSDCDPTTDPLGPK